jgi:hypothetical protein
MEVVVNDIKNKVLNSVLTFYSNFCKENKIPKRIKFKGDRTDIGDVNDYILDIIDYLDNKYPDNYFGEVNNSYIENNLDEIIKSINDQIIFKYKKIERLDWENEFETVNTIASYHKADKACDSELCFIQYMGYTEEPGEIIRFLIKALLADLSDNIE